MSGEKGGQQRKQDTLAGRDVLPGGEERRCTKPRRAGRAEEVLYWKLRRGKRRKAEDTNPKIRQRNKHVRKDGRNGTDTRQEWDGEGYVVGRKLEGRHKETKQRRKEAMQEKTTGGECGRAECVENTRALET